MLMMLGVGVSSLGRHPADAHDARGLGFQTRASTQLMLMMLGGWGFQTRASSQLMLMMLQASSQLILMMLGLGFQTRASSQLMLMMLGGWGFNPGQLPADAHDARGWGFKPGPAPS